MKKFNTKGKHMIKIIGNTDTERNTWLRGLLTKGVYNITFNKINGETRTMPCTLKADMMPPVVIKEGKEARAPKQDTISVWCIDKQEWRAFKVMNITEIQEHNEIAYHPV